MCSELFWIVLSCLRNRLHDIPFWMSLVLCDCMHFLQIRNQENDWEAKRYGGDLGCSDPCWNFTIDRAPPTYRYLVLQIQKYLNSRLWFFNTDIFTGIFLYLNWRFLVEYPISYSHMCCGSWICSVRLKEFADPCRWSAHQLIAWKYLYPPGIKSGTWNSFSSIWCSSNSCEIHW